MYWNYRVLKQINKQNEPYFEVCEVHYDENDIPHTSYLIPHTWGKIMPAESLDELKYDYEYMRKAFESPVLTVVENKLVQATD